MIIHYCISHRELARRFESYRAVPNDPRSALGEALPAMEVAQPFVILLMQKKEKTARLHDEFYH
jgi:hypothetical protein